MNLEKDLFKLFQENKDCYDLFKKTQIYIEKTIKEVKGKENAEFYNYVVRLLDSINNAGWEERHSKQIDLLWEIQNKIVKDYEDYLP